MSCCCGLAAQTTHVHAPSRTLFLESVAITPDRTGGRLRQVTQRDGYDRERLLSQESIPFDRRLSMDIPHGEHIAR